MVSAQHGIYSTEEHRPRSCRSLLAERVDPVQIDFLAAEEAPGAFGA